MITAGFLPGQGKDAHGIGWQMEVSPTLRGGYAAGSADHF